jgi:hypothetical protein
MWQAKRVSFDMTVLNHVHAVQTFSVVHFMNTTVSFN